MSRRAKTAQILLTAAAVLLAAACVALLLHDTLAMRAHPGYLEAVSASNAARVCLVNVNTDDLAHLQELPGVGETLAQRIIDYREANGPFSCAEDLLKVNGIGEKTLERLRGGISF